MNKIKTLDDFKNRFLPNYFKNEKQAKLKKDEDYGSIIAHEILNNIREDLREVKIS